MRRNLPLTSSWPHQMVRTLNGPDAAAEVSQLFLKDISILKAFKAFGGLVPADQLVIKRHVCNLTCNKQYEVGLSLNRNNVTTEFTDLVKRRHSGVIATQIVEDINGEQNNSGQIRGAKKYRKPETGLATVLRNHTIDKRHHFQEVPFNLACTLKSSRLPDDAFVASPADDSLPFKEIESTKQETAWWSPSATNHTIPAADLSMLREVDRVDDFRLVRQAWLGKLFDLSRKTVFCRKVGGAQDWSYYIAGYHFPASSVLAWPVDVVSISCFFNCILLSVGLYCEMWILCCVFSTMGCDFRALTYNTRVVHLEFKVPGSNYECRVSSCES